MLPIYFQQFGNEKKVSLSSTSSAAAAKVITSGNNSNSCMKSQAAAAATIKLLDLKSYQCVECECDTDHVCAQCIEPFCSACFRRVHAAGIVFQRHKLILAMTDRNAGGGAAALNNGVVGILCAQHPIDGILNLYCNQCEQVMCYKCRVDTHDDHEYSTLLIEVTIATFFWFFLFLYLRFFFKYLFLCIMTQNRKTLPKLRQLKEQLKTIRKETVECLEVSKIRRFFFIDFFIYIYV